jgi:DNA-binding SARP family transcriptional activator
MNISVLGPLRVRCGGVDITPTAGKQAQLLALLALHRQRVVPLTDIIRELWPEAVPRTANAAIHTYISKLRGGVAHAMPSADPKAVLVGTVGGYRMDLPDGAVDHERFDHLTDLGNQLIAGGDDVGASAHFREALGLWSGDPLGELRTGPLLELWKLNLKERRRTVLDRCVDTDLRLGRHQTLISELLVHASQNSSCEQVHFQLMLALHRSGRRIQALEVYRKLRRELIDRFGIEPSARLQALHQAILASDRSHPQGFTPTPIPHQRTPQPASAHSECLIQGRPPMVGV